MNICLSKFPVAALLAFVLTFSGATVLSASSHKQDGKDETTAGDVKQKAGETYTALKEYSLEQRDEAVAAAKKRLKELDARIESMQQNLDENWQEMSQEARQRTRTTMKALRQQRQDVAEWYGGVQHSSAEAWEEVKKGFAASYDRLEKAIVKARDEFTDKEKQEKEKKNQKNGS